MDGAKIYFLNQLPGHLVRSVSSELIQPSRSDQEKKVEVSRNLSSSVRHEFMFKGKLQYGSQLSLLFTEILLQGIKVHHSYLSACNC